MLGLLCRGARECAARKRHVFCALLRRVSDATRSARLAGTHVASATTFAALSPNIRAACMRIHSAAAAFIDEVKDRAVASTFLEPARLYCEVTGHSAAPDLDVHGVSTFLAALEAAGGIRTARVPAWEDVAKGAMDFAGAGAMEPDVLDALAADAALGRSYLAALGSAVCTPAQFAAWRRAWRPAPAHRFIWPGEAVSTRAFAARVVDATPANAPARAA